MRTNAVARRRAFTGIFLFLAAMFAAPLALGGPTGPITIHVDARDISRSLVHSEMIIPVEPGPLDLYYVLWTPGSHSASGPIQNVVNFRITDAEGNTLRWDRDPTKVVRVTTNVPQGTDTITVNLSYIANQPSVTSESTDSYGYDTLGAINWNTVLVYPGGADKDELMYRPSLQLPEGWEQASALDVLGRGGDTYRFAPVSLAELVDSPVIFGEHLITYRFEIGDRPPHYIDAVAAKPERLELPAKRLREFEEMVIQSEKVFGPFPRSQFRFLIMVDSRLPGFGLEHGESTFIDMSDDEFVNADTEDATSMGVVPHEYVHCWNGKLRVPEVLLAREYHTGRNPELMWVYEGLTSYYDDVVSVRCGLISEDEFTNSLAARIQHYQLQQGRTWRSLRDTARFLGRLRARSEQWGDLRRRQDYYSEGALFWMEADAIIRSGTNGRKSLDDFTKAFFNVAAGPVGSLSEYDRAEVVRTLEQTYAGEDWDALIRERIESPVETLKIVLPERLGYELRLTNEPTDEQRKDISDSRGVNLRNSLGFSANKDGEVTSIVPGSAADVEKFDYGMKITAVSDQVFSPDALRDAVRESPETGFVELLLATEEGTLRRVTFDYDGGMRHPRLVPIQGRDDHLTPIMQPR